MKHDIDLFGMDGKSPWDHRWDTDRNAKLLNIVFIGGTFGHFLKYFLEKFSNKTPNIIFKMRPNMLAIHHVQQWE